MKKIIYIIFFLFAYSVLAQRNEKLKFNEISFIQKDSISNIDEYKKSTLELFVKMDSTFLPLLGEVAESFGANELRKKKNEDSLIQVISKEKIEKSIITFHYKKINDSIIERYDKTIIQWEVFL